jgi:hypothetical protein
MNKEIWQELEKIPFALTWCGIGILAASFFMSSNPEEGYLVYLFSGMFFIFLGSLGEISVVRRRRRSIHGVPHE